MPKAAEFGKRRRGRPARQCGAVVKQTTPATRRNAKKDEKKGSKSKALKTPKNTKIRSPPQREPNIARSQKTNFKLKMFKIRLKRMKFSIEENTTLIKKSNKKDRANSRKVPCSTATTESENIEPFVKQELIEEVDEFEEKSSEQNQQMQYSLELNDEVKIEYDCETNGNTISTIKPILIEEPINKELSIIRDQGDKAKLDSLRMLTSGTKFSKIPSIKTKDEAIRLIGLLESFALCKENFRLIGFVERLQNHFERRTA
ncbi:uncharacterized protein LOC129947417 [Eupeodes corollae]|uniref:uncharacterized protein LOC129947417 n=1 Tax=Eupeodes corollae TaxID=290404 RepID=UPI0024901DFD|nr:uncharacterized protein LOC129947417 [Eupeodes corollae]